MILAVHSFPGGNDAVARHYPYWQRVGFERIIGIGTMDGGCRWPQGMESVNIGDNTYINGDALPKRLVNTAAYLLEGMIGFWDYAAIVEYDTVTFKPLPVPAVGELAMVCAGGPQAGRKGRWFYHNPWVASYQTWRQIVDAGRSMLQEGDFENGSPDCFIGWLAERFNIPVDQNLFRTYSRNTIESWCADEARDAYRSGVHAIHGIKSKEILDKIIS